jgi:hypothetical protein
MCTGKRSQKAVGSRTSSHDTKKNMDSQEKGEIFPYSEENKLTFSRFKKAGTFFCEKEQTRRLL